MGDARNEASTSGSVRPEDEPLFQHPRYVKARPVMRRACQTCLAVLRVLVLLGADGGWRKPVHKGARYSSARSGARVCTGAMAAHARTQHTPTHTYTDVHSRTRTHTHSRLHTHTRSHTHIHTYAPHTRCAT